MFSGMSIHVQLQFEKVHSQTLTNCFVGILNYIFPLIMLNGMYFSSMSVHRLNAWSITRHANRVFSPFPPPVSFTQWPGRDLQQQWPDWRPLLHKFGALFIKNGANLTTLSSSLTLPGRFDSRFWPARDCAEVTWNWRWKLTVFCSSIRKHACKSWFAVFIGNIEHSFINIFPCSDLLRILTASILKRTLEQTQ